jgi:hypothetical protein
VEALEAAFKEVVTFEEADLLSYGLPVFGFTIERQASVRRLENLARFKEHFGVKPLTVAALLNDLKKEFTKDFRIKEALMTLYWLKCYGTEHTIAGPWNVGCLDELRKTVKRVTRNISALKNTRLCGETLRRAAFIHTLWIVCIA